jgi:hypothetical protein
MTVKKKKPVEETDKRKYIVFLSQVGRYNKGIVHGFASIDGKSAFVRRSESGTHAEIVPAANIFDTEKEAQAYLAGEGVRRWVVGEDERGRYACPKMFEAKVVYYHYMGTYSAHYRVSVKRIRDGKVVDLTHFAAFNTKKQAESHFAKVWREKHKDLTKELVDYKEHLAKLMKNKPREKKAPVRKRMGPKS